MSNNSTTTCPNCPTCSSCSKCVSQGELIKATGKLLKPFYTLAVSINGGGIHNYSLSITSTDTGFTYTADYLNTGFSFSSRGFIYVSAINFILPLVVDSTFYSLNCTAVLNPVDGSISDGSCGSIQFVNANQLNQVGGSISSR